MGRPKRQCSPQSRLFRDSEIWLSASWMKLLLAPDILFHRLHGYNSNHLPSFIEILLPQGVSRKNLGSRTYHASSVCPLSHDAEQVDEACLCEEGELVRAFAPGHCDHAP